MHRPDYLSLVKDRIINAEKGTIFITSDFFDLAGTDAINQVLSRLTKAGIIRRIMRGVYEQPEYNEFLDEYIAPSPEKIAKALARNYGWTISPCGDVALNQLGLSTQVPSVWSFVSSGPYREYSYGHIKLEFKHIADKEIAKLSYKTALVIQALKALGRDNINSQVYKMISDRLSEDEKKTMQQEAKHTTTWVYEAIKKICIEVINEANCNNAREGP